MMLINLCAESKKNVLEGDKIYMAAVEGNSSVYQVYPVSRIISVGRAIF